MDSLIELSNKFKEHMKNQKPKPTIKNVRKGKIAIRYAGDLELLRKVLGIAFPTDNTYLNESLISWCFVADKFGRYFKILPENLTDLPTFSESEIILNERIWNTEDLGNGDVQLYCKDYHKRNSQLIIDADEKLRYKAINADLVSCFVCINLFNGMFINIKAFDVIPIATENEILTKAEFSERFIDAVIGKSFKIKNEHQAKWLLTMVKKWISGLSWVEITEDRINDIVRYGSVTIFETSYNCAFTDEAIHSFYTLKPFGYVKPKKDCLQIIVDDYKAVTESVTAKPSGEAYNLIVDVPAPRDWQALTRSMHEKTKYEPYNLSNNGITPKQAPVPVISDGKKSMALVVFPETEFVPVDVLISTNGLNELKLINKNHTLYYSGSYKNWVINAYPNQPYSMNTGISHQYLSLDFGQVKLGQIFKYKTTHYIKTSDNHGMFWRNDETPGKHHFNTRDSVKLVSVVL